MQEVWEGSEGMRLYISLPKRYDKTEIVFVRKSCKKRQKTIKVDFEKLNVTNEKEFATPINSINIMQRLEERIV
jgi:hypothetical protein